MSAFVVACGKDESGGDDDDDGDTTNTTNTPTTNTTSNPTTNTATSGNPTNTATSNGGSSSTTAGQGGSGGSGGTMGVGGSAGSPEGGAGGSAGAPEGGAGGGGTTTGGEVVVEDDCSFEACGGELANSDWDYSRICVEKDALLAPFQGFCETIDVVSASGEVAGTIAFTDDAYIQDVTFSVTGEFAVPTDCIVLSCAVVGLGLASAGLTDTSCVESDTGCLCSGTLLGESAVDGDYSVDGETLTLDDAEASYCAEGDSFKYIGEIEGVEFVYETVPQ